MNANFSKLNNDAVFMCNGTMYRKRSSRTANLLESDMWFYFGKDERVKLIKDGNSCCTVYKITTRDNIEKPYNGSVYSETVVAVKSERAALLAIGKKYKRHFRKIRGTRNTWISSDRDFVQVLYVTIINKEEKNQ